MKRAQVTLFIIIGVVALFMAGLMLYYVGLQAKKSSPEFEDVTPVKNYVTSCVSKLSEEALILAGQQAGIIFTFQDGQYPEFQNKHEDKFFNLRKKDRNAPVQAQRGRGRQPGQEDLPATPDEDENVVPSGLLRPEDNLAVYYASPYEYPWIYFPYTPHNQNPSFSDSSKSYNGYFGLNVMPKLNKDDAPLSIQYEIESFIGSRLKDCTNGFVLFPEYKIEEKEVAASVLFADEDTVINVTYPLEIRKKAGGEVTKLSEFTAAKKVRMKKIHEVANWIINNDISDITYDIQKQGIYYGMNIEREPVDTNENVGTFITITDPESVLNDKQYEFMFTRQNRNPGLEYIKDMSVSPCSYDIAKSEVACNFEWHDHRRSCGKDCCYCEKEGHPSSYTIRSNYFPESAKEPDEDAYEISYNPNIKSNPITLDWVKGTVTRDIKQIVDDSKLEDWQTVKFIITWSQTVFCSC